MALDFNAGSGPMPVNTGLESLSESQSIPKASAWKGFKFEETQPMWATPVVITSFTCAGIILAPIKSVSFDQ